MHAALAKEGFTRANAGLAWEIEIYYLSWIRV